MSIQSDFINRIAPAAQRVSAQTGVPASVIISQAALESRWGQSDLSKKYNNYFGVKGKGVALPTYEYRNGVPKVEYAQFKTYNSLDESLLDYAKTLRNDRYKNAFRYTNDPAKFVQEVKNGGYATDPNYVKHVLGVINSNNLTKYDKPGTIPPTYSPAQTQQVAPPQTQESSGWLGKTVSNVVGILLFFFVLIVAVWSFGRVFNVSIPTNPAQMVLQTATKGGK